MPTFARVGDLPYRVVGNQKKTVTDVAMDSSYPTGGEAVTAANLGLNRVEYATAEITTTATTTVNATAAGYLPATEKLLVFDETPAEAANAADLAGLVVRVVAFGF